MSLKHQQAFTLIEVMIAVAIFILGLLGLSSLQLEVNKNTADLGNRSQVNWIADDLVNRIRANLDALNNYNTNGAIVDCNNVPAWCADQNGIDSPICSRADMAAFDLWQVACPVPAQVGGADVTYSNAASYVNNLELSTQVLPNNRISITLEWDVRTSGQDAAGNQVFNSDFQDNNVAELRRQMTTEYTL